MNHLIDFVKIQATGNDFVVCSGEELLLNELEPEVIKRICNRQFGIGSDGFIVIGGHKTGQLSMRYFNSDGTAGEMCGNGLRAAVLFSYVSGFIKNSEWYTIDATDGQHQVKYFSTDKIQVEIAVKGQPESIDGQELTVPDNLNIWGFINTGVPHLVLNTNHDIENLDVYSIGKHYRYHDRFQNQGTNVDFVEITGKNRIKVRTYERGVEQETLSCGTGVTASALFYRRLFPTDAKQIIVETKGGILEVMQNEDRIFLTGPARISYTGHYLLESEI
jgi:diaminopimelate epimerase